MNIGIVVVVYSEYPKLCFEGVVGRTIHDVKWFVHCHTADLQIIKELQFFAQANPCELTLHGHNRGLSRSWNDGIWRSFQHENEITLVINDDVLFKSGALDRFIEFLSMNPGFGIGVLYGEEPNGADGSSKTVKQDFACFAFGFNAFGKIGAFDENFFPAYCEDIDYGWRIGIASISSIVDSRVLVVHERNKSIKKDAALRVAIRAAEAKNWEYFFEKWSCPYEKDFVGETTWPQIRIRWSDRVRPSGLPIRPDLGLDEGHAIVVSSLEQVVEVPEDQIFQNARDRAIKICEAMVQASFVALLGRLPERSALDLYAVRLVDGHLGLIGLIDILKESAEYRRASSTAT